MIGRTVLVVVSLHGAGCGSGPPPYVDGGPPRVLEVLTPPGSQIGLHYGKTIDLRVGYHLDDATQTPLAGGRVHFAIFDDPGGSTLSADRVVADSGGVATVQLTAGAEERSFRVRATADGAPDAEFGVTVSRLEFVNFDVVLAFPPDLGTVKSLRALLYMDTPCSQLPPTPSPPDPFRQLSANGPPPASLSFLNLASHNYAVVGRGEDAAGHLVAAGCVDLAPSALPPGTSAEVPVLLSAIVPTVTGAFAITTTLTLGAASPSPVKSAWHKLNHCATAPADQLLDGIEAAVDVSTMSAIESKRGASVAGCRPAMAGGMPSLDAQLEALVTAAGTPGAKLDAIVKDLDALLGAATLASRLVITDAGPKALAAEHTLSKITLGTQGYDLAATALPIIDVKDVPVTFDGATLSIGLHRFTLGLGQLQRRALDEQTIPTELPSLMMPTPTILFTQAVAAVQRAGKTGCAAVEDLVCTITGAAGCVGVVAPACASATAAIGASLEASFTAADPFDLSLAGSGRATDTKGLLLVDVIDPASWSTPLADSAPFSGVRVAP